MKLVFRKSINSLDSICEITSCMHALFKPETVLLIDGDLGAGKTTFVTYLLNEKGYENISSPTYALHNSYSHKDNQNHFLKIEHVDLYRLNTSDDIESTGFWDLFLNKNSLIIIEWAERINNNLWPLNWNQYYLNIQTG